MNYDVIVVGARCAGSPLAMLLARQGHSVLLLDRARFPSDTMSTHWIQQSGVALLHKWGLLEQVTGTGCPPIETISMDMGPLVLTGRPLPVDGIGQAYAPRRTVLDAILAGAAQRAGAELREDFTVEDVVWDGATVVGVRGRSKRGQTVSERARMVIGADGLHSTIARCVGAEPTEDRGVLTAAYYTYWSGVTTDGVEAYFRGRRGCALWPTHDGLTVVTVAWPRSEFAANRRNVEQNYWATLELAPQVAERLRAGQREAPFTGSGQLANIVRKPYGPGWALAGDAGHHKDPITAQGISDAFDDAEMLAAAVHQGLTSAEPMQQQLAGYEADRNRKRAAMFEFTCQQASLTPPPPEMQQLLGAIHRNQDATDRFMSLLAGSQPFDEFFDPANLSQIMDTPTNIEPREGVVIDEHTA